MIKQNFDINKLRVASPCSASWATMAGNDRKRFCNLCELNVYNFSEMTSEEVRQLVAESDGRICGRLYRRADGTVLTKDCPVGLRAYQKRVARFAGAALTAILGLFSISFGQKTDEKTVEGSNVKIVRMATPRQSSILTGRILDNKNTPISGAEIKLIDINKKEFSTKSDNRGKYEILNTPSGIYTLAITSAGFLPLQITQTEIKENERNNFDITLEFDPNITVTSGYLMELPKAERNFTELLKLTTGVQPQKNKPKRPKD